MKNKKKALSLLIAAAFCIGLAPHTVQMVSAEKTPDNGQPITTKSPIEFSSKEAQSAEPGLYGVDINLGNLNLANYETIMAYAGYEWWVVGGGDANTAVGLNPGGKGTVTLFLRNRTLSEIGNQIPFREGYETQPTDNPESYKKHTGTHKTSFTDETVVTAYYAKNPAQMAEWNNPNEYAGSTVQQALEEAAELLPNKEKAYIIPRGFEGSDGKIASKDGIVGQGLSNQYLWILSESEWEKLKTVENITNVVTTYGNEWWLRTPGHSEFCKNDCGFHATSVLRTSKQATNLASSNVADVRPALTLKIPSQDQILMMTETYDPLASSLNKTGKALAEKGQGFIELKRPDTTNSNSRLKFTMLDETQKLQISANKDDFKAGEKIKLSYVFTHENEDKFSQHDYYVSCMVRNESGELLGYAKLSDAKANPQASVELDLNEIREKLKLSDGDYQFFFFSEEANGALHTDFASAPVAMTVKVTNDSAAVQEFHGHIHDWDMQSWKSDDGGHWRRCKAQDCPETGKKFGYEAHRYDGGECTVCDATDKNFKPSITAGADSTWYRGSKTGLSITSDAAIAHFQKVQVDGKDLDKINYEVKEGSTIVTLKTAYLESLPKGKHTVSIVSKTGTAETTFTIENGESNTGDESSPALWIALMLLALAGAGGTAIYSKKNKAK